MYINLILECVLNEILGWGSFLISVLCRDVFPKKFNISDPESCNYYSCILWKNSELSPVSGSLYRLDAGRAKMRLSKL